MSTQRQPVAVIGTGYVGLVTAAGFAELGSEVWCVDIDVDKIDRLNAGEVPIYEPGLPEVLESCRARMHFTTELADALEHARLLFVAVGTPSTYSGDADLSAVHSVVGALPASDEHALIMKSTVPVGTGRHIRRELDRLERSDYAYVSCPEFLREGTALADFRSPDRVVIGDEGGWAGDAVAELYAPLDAPVVRTDISSAEMVKLASNAFLATKISFINEIANVCEETGANVGEVARGMGLDTRIGDSFLQPGIGYGGSCLVAEETVLARHHGRTTLLSLEALWERIEREDGSAVQGELAPHRLEVLTWIPGTDIAQFLPVMLLTRRSYAGEIVQLETKMGRRVRCTLDHPWWSTDGGSAEASVKLASELTTEDWLPLAAEADGPGDEAGVAALIAAAERAELSPDQIIVRPPAARLRELASRSIEERRHVFARSASAAARTGELKRTGTIRLDELARAEMPLEGSRISTTKNGSQPSSELALDAAFWRVAGLYLAEGHTTVETGGKGVTCRIHWSFHPDREQHLVDEVVAYWLRHGVHARVRRTPTSMSVRVDSRLLGTWWTKVLGLGRNGYEQRLPDLVWDRCEADKWMLLSGLWEGDGSWSLIKGGPSVILEMGTVSDELADGVMRLLGQLGVVASRRTGRTALSTKDTHWLRISGAAQIERCIELVPERDRRGVRCAIAAQKKRIAPTGYRRFGEGPSWVRVTGVARSAFEGSVYSMEVPGAHTFVTTGGLITSNCFPKDVTALKQLAGNSGYHFQLLNAVIEVNELQKRRVVAKLQKHVGQLAGATVALLGLAFKPNTDDMREASSLVLAARLQAEGANVRAYDPVAEQQARSLMTNVEFAESALGAVKGADAVVLVTEWPEFAELDWAAVAEAMSGKTVVDGRNALDMEAVTAAGLVYEGVGRP